MACPSGIKYVGLGVLLGTAAGFTGIIQILGFLLGYTVLLGE